MNQGPDTPIGTMIDSLIESLWEAQGTELLLVAGGPAVIRIRGELRPVSGPSMSGDDISACVRTLLTPRQQSLFDVGEEVDFSFEWRSRARIRGSSFSQQATVAVAFRVVPRLVPTLDQVQVPPVARSFAQLRRGLVFLTGPNGSGKTTTLAALIDAINTERAVHVLTIEDPIEYIHDRKRSVVTQREVGQDTESFAHALRRAMRENPDVVAISDLNEHETIGLALTLAETGPLVLATIHAGDITHAVERLIDTFPLDQRTRTQMQLATNLTGIVHQRLLPRSGGGVIPAYEVLLATPSVRNLIREGKFNQLHNQIITGHEVGMQSLESSLNALVAAGSVSYEEASAATLHPEEITRSATSGYPTGAPTPRRPGAVIH